MSAGSSSSPPPDGASRGGIRVLDKAFELIDALAEAGELSAAELAARLGEPRPTVYRLLSGLRAHEIVATGSRRGSFRLGLGLVRLGGAVLAGQDVRAAALPAMTDLHERTSETVFLCVRSGDAAVCIERLEGLHVQSLAMRLGGSLPLHVGAAGVALLAFEPSEEWDRYLDATPLSPLTPHTDLTAARVRRTLADTHDRGYSISDQDVTIGIAALGAPILDHLGRVVAAVSVSGVREVILGEPVRAENVTSVRATAERISRALGYDGAAPGAVGRGPSQSISA